ncbi:inositol monophosphatase [Roseococcus sp. SDR]|uniref:inositol monophosphatase family protein n=1 Tax=Roseococcus sp. SDR TaxID=2835532 RepID=UPI001BD0F0B9|nr:inositol monophosphatase [Roseococcus sp. SDR]MBS7790623.1 inositol monophosphatase [Roseococcus sp. SDR]MBV1845937.1 inositol monophosphatase [Roseococcus sp. SDR]
MRLSATQASEIAGLLREAAQAEILPRFRRLASGDIRAKSGPLDLVTEADEAAERRLSAALAARYPKAMILGEEATAADPGLLTRMLDAELCFVLDPVDGTANFAGGVPLFGVMLAAVQHGETIAGWIHDPMGDDTAIALRGEGAWIEAPSGHRVDCRVAAPAPLGRMVGAISWGFLPPERKAHLLPRLSLLAGTLNFRCAAHEYRLAATGGLHALFYNKLMPWDHAAGALLHAEAGGYSAQFDGSIYSPRKHIGGLICAPDREGWQALREGLLG